MEAKSSAAAAANFTTTKHFPQPHRQKQIIIGTGLSKSAITISLLLLIVVCSVQHCDGTAQCTRTSQRLLQCSQYFDTYNVALEHKVMDGISAQFGYVSSDITGVSL